MISTVLGFSSLRRLDVEDRELRLLLILLSIPPRRRLRLASLLFVPLELVVLPPTDEASDGAAFLGPFLELMVGLVAFECFMKVA